MGRGDVEEGDLVRALPVVLDRAVDRVTDLLDADEVDPFDHHAVAHVEAWDDAFG